MRLAISNLAWDPSLDGEAARLLSSFDLDGVELAPTKIWPRPLAAAPSEIRAYRRFWEERGVRIVALQSLLFGRPDLTVFGSPGVRDATAEYLEGMIRVAAELGAGRLVFGSPRNRCRGDLPAPEAGAILTEFFGRLGRCARRCGTIMCIEPNPAEYQCDCIRTAAEGLELVRQVNDDGFGLHLDAGGMTLSQDSPQFLEVNAAHVRHFHISEPYLATIGSGATDHASFAAALTAGAYSGCVSIEMKPAEEGEPLEHARRSLTLARRWYGA